jgi:hypothetical protein
MRQSQQMPVYILNRMQQRSLTTTDELLQYYKYKKVCSFIRSFIGDVIYDRYETNKNQMMGFERFSSWSLDLLCGQSESINRGLYIRVQILQCCRIGEDGVHFISMK